MKIVIVRKMMEIPFDNEELFEAISEILETRVRPTLKKDGGNIALVKVEKPKVFVQLQGACVGCASSGNTLKYIVEKEIKTFIHPQLEIVNLA
jgi:Fe-S cluster biogenesis protein NfuA